MIAVGTKVKARDREDKWRAARVAGHTVVDFGSAAYSMYRVEFVMGGSRWVRAHEVREGVLS